MEDEDHDQCAENCALFYARIVVFILSVYHYMIDVKYSLPNKCSIADF